MPNGVCLLCKSRRVNEDEEKAIDNEDEEEVVNSEDDQVPLAAASLMFMSIVRN